MNVATFLLLNQTTNAALASIRETYRESEDEYLSNVRKRAARNEYPSLLCPEVKQELQRKQEEQNKKELQRKIDKKQAYLRSLSVGQLRRYNRLMFVKLRRSSFEKTLPRPGEISRYFDVDDNVISHFADNNGGYIMKVLYPSEYMRRSFKAPVSSLDVRVLPQVALISTMDFHKEIIEKFKPKEIVVVEPLVEENIIEDKPTSKVGNTIGVLSIIGILFVFGYIYMKATL